METFAYPIVMDLFYYSKTKSYSSPRHHHHHHHHQYRETMAERKLFVRNCRDSRDSRDNAGLVLSSRGVLGRVMIEPTAYVRAHIPPPTRMCCEKTHIDPSASAHPPPKKQRGEVVVDADTLGPAVSSCCCKFQLFVAMFISMCTLADQRQRSYRRSVFKSSTSAVLLLLLVLGITTTFNDLSVVDAFTPPQYAQVRATQKPTNRVALKSSRRNDEASSDAQEIRHENLRRHVQSQQKPAFTPRTSTTTRRSLLSQATTTAAAALTTCMMAPLPSSATIGKDSYWNLWPALPVAPFARRRTIRYEVGPKVWAFDQMIGIYYVQVPIRMTAVAREGGGLLVYAPIAPTRECLSLMQELIDEYGPVKDIILPSVAVEHKVNAGPFARAFPDANFYVVDKQYAFPLNLPNSFLGLPSWTQPLPRSSSAVGNDGKAASAVFGGEFEHEVLTVKPGIGSMYQDVALFHKPSKTLLVCDAVFAVNGEPPRILTEEEEYTRALLFHAREYKDEIVEDTPENRRKGWRRIVLLFNFFFPGSGRGDLGVGPIGKALKTPGYKDGWGGWKPFSWGQDEIKDFEVFSAGGKPTILPIIQIILSRGPDEVKRWLDVVGKWDFTRVVPAHLDAPLSIGPEEFKEPFSFVESGRNEVRFCDEDVAFLRAAEEGPLSFSVYKSSLGALKGKNACGLVKPLK